MAPEMLADVMETIKLKPPMDIVRAAKAERRRKDALVGTGYRPGDRNATDRRWIGHMAESMLDIWLTDRGLQHEWFGGVDNLPDFVIEGQNVAVKCCHGLMYSDFFVFVSQRQQQSLHEHLFFTGYNSRENILRLIGGMRTSDFFEVATKQSRGSKYATTHDLKSPTATWKLSARELVPVEEFLAGLVA